MTGDVTKATVQSRLSVRRKQNCFMALKSDNTVALTAGRVSESVPHWRNNLHRDRKLMVASIPMARNLVEYTAGDAASDFTFLTPLLHRKLGSDTITMLQLAEVMSGVLTMTATGGTEKVIDVILLEAGLCMADGQVVNFEKKVVLSIRLLAEDLMISKINDTAKTDSITSNQTRELFNIYKDAFPGDSEALLHNNGMQVEPEGLRSRYSWYHEVYPFSEENALWRAPTN